MENLKLISVTNVRSLIINTEKVICVEQLSQGVRIEMEGGISIISDRTLENIHKQLTN